MGRLARCCLQSLLKLVNSVIGFVGLGMILYSLWMLRVWYKNTHSFWDDSNPPWFIYTFLGLGVSLCLITCSGHIAAETANGHCLSCYMVFVFLLVMLEATITADIFLNRNWEEDFPEDDTGRFNDLKNFVKSNFEMCKWIGLGIVGAQRVSPAGNTPCFQEKGSRFISQQCPSGDLTLAISIFLAMVLRALGSDHGSYYDSDDEYVPVRLPLLKNQVQHTPYIVDPRLALRNDSWNMKINDKVNRG